MNTCKACYLMVRDYWKWCPWCGNFLAFVAGASEAKPPQAGLPSATGSAPERSDKAESIADSSGRSAPVKRSAAVVKACNKALDAMALAWRDIFEWENLALHQRENEKEKGHDPDRVPYVPSQYGLNASKDVMKKLTDADRELRNALTAAEPAPAVGQVVESEARPKAKRAQARNTDYKPSR